MKKSKPLFVQGAIPAQKLADSVAHHSSQVNIGAHAIFLGQVRADQVGDATVTAIDYSAHEEMAQKVYDEIREACFSRYAITCAHVYHSLGEVAVGTLCFYVFTSAERRKDAIDACSYFVEQIKANVPIFGKEVLSDASYQWKVNR